MQYNMSMKMMGGFLIHLFKNDLDKPTREAVKKEYQAILERAGDIGANNTLLGSYILCAVFIALVRKSGMDVEKCAELLEDHLRKSKIFKMAMGDSKGYFSEKHMQKRYAWSKETHERHYKNDWVVDVLPKSDDYEFGFNYTECGVCKMCKDEGCFELAKYLCRLDYMLVEIMGIGLKRTSTLAEGGDKCDFRFIKK